MAWLYKQRASKKWYVGYRVNGKLIQRTTQTADRKIAQQQLDKLESVAHAHAAGSLTQEFIRHLTRVESANDTLHAYREQWLKECRDLSGNTVERYRDVLNDFSEFVKANETAPLLRDIQPDSIAAFLRAKRDKKSVGTVKLTRRVLAVFFNYCVDNRALQFTPVPSSKSLKLARGRAKSTRRAFTLTELKTIYAKCPDDFWRYMVMAGFFTGQRLGDLVTLTWANVDFEQNQIRLTARKTGRAIVCPISAELRALLNGLKRDAGTVKPTTPIWPEKSRLYEQQGAKAFSNTFYEDVLLPAGLVAPRTHHPKKLRPGEVETERRKINEVSFHCLRHSFVSMLKITGASQSTAKELAGHSSDQISDLYTHVDEATLARAIKQLPEVTK